MGLSNELSCEAGSFFCCLNLHRFFHSEVLRFYFPSTEPWVAWSILLPVVRPSLSTHKCATAWSTSHHLTWCANHPWPTSVLQPLPCCKSFPPRLPISALPTDLDECFFFKSLVVGLTYSLIFWQFWLFFVFKFVVLLLVVQGGKVYLPMSPSWPEVQILSFK